MKKVIIVGAGASGMFAAWSASVSGKEVTVIEKNDIPGKKLLITGKGRCNITNNCSMQDMIESITKNGSFLYSSLASFGPHDIIGFFEQNKLKTTTERGNRVFPANGNAKDVTDTIYGVLKKNKVTFVFNKTVKGLIIENHRVKGVKTCDDRIIEADSVIICTGGMSYPKTGSDGSGYHLASSAGHKITELKPGLAPLEVKQDWVKSLQGLSLKNVVLSAFSGNNRIFSEMGEMLFTHFGISGPLVLSLSSRIYDQNDLRLSIDLKPALEHDTLDKRILRDFEISKNKLYKNSLNRLLPSKLIPVIVTLSGIDPQKPVNSITREERSGLGDLLKDLSMTYSKTRPVEEGIITRGGISLKEIDPKTMGSKLVKGLYFAGEIMDLDAPTGGFNLTIAFSTGYKAGIMS